MVINLVQWARENNEKLSEKANSHAMFITLQDNTLQLPKEHVKIVLEKPVKVFANRKKG